VAASPAECTRAGRLGVTLLRVGATQANGLPAYLPFLTLNSQAEASESRVRINRHNALKRRGPAVRGAVALTMSPLKHPTVRAHGERQPQSTEQKSAEHIAGPVLTQVDA
jgi:hypothetical protein